MQFQVHRTPLFIEGDSGHERHLVLRAPTRLAARAEVGVVELDGAAEGWVLSRWAVARWIFSCSNQAVG